MTTSKEKNNAGLGLIALIAIVVSSMIGAGIDGLPQNMAQSSAVVPVLIAWAIAGFGIFFIALTFIILNKVHPELKDGILLYARNGFGHFTAFNVAWGYWLMCIFSNVAYGVMLMDAMDYFFPGSFTGGNNFASIVGTTILIWGFNFIVLSGARDASLINIVGTIAKLLPLFSFIFVVMYFFKDSNFGNDIWGQTTEIKGEKLGSIYSQIMSPLDIALWCFIGIEGAVVLSGRARKSSDVAKATLYGFIISLVLCVLVSVLPFGVMSQAQLSGLETPSTAGIFNVLLGKSGEYFINIGVVVSVLSAWLAWTMLCAEVPMSAAKHHIFPAVFAKQNRDKAASVSLYVSSAIMQLAVVVVYYSNNAWETLLDVSTLTVLPAYLASTLYLFKIALINENKQFTRNRRLVSLITGAIGAVFCVFMFAVSDIKYVAMVPLFLTFGLPFYVIARSKNVKIFNKKDLWLLAILLILDVISVFYLISGI